MVSMEPSLFLPPPCQGSPTKDLTPLLIRHTPPPGLATLLAAQFGEGYGMGILLFLRHDVRIIAYMGELAKKVLTCKHELV